MRRSLGGWMGLGAALALLGAPGAAQADFADHFARRTDIPSSKAPSHGRSRILVVPLEVVVVETLVTKNSSVPTLITAF